MNDPSVPNQLTDLERKSTLIKVAILAALFWRRSDTVDLCLLGR